MTKGQWLTLMEYAQYRDISVSTVRRYIKSDRVKHKLLNGKYLIYVTEENIQKRQTDKAKDDLEVKLENERLKMQLQKLTEENAELKMLVQIYEGQKRQNQDTPPPLELE